MVLDAISIRSNLSRKLLAATALTALNLVAVPVLAQTSPETAADSSEVETGEILVTARKTTERLLDVPVNVSAFNNQSIQNMGIKNLYDLVQTTPGISYGNTGSRNGNKLTARGLGISTTGSNKVSVFLDGVYIAGDFTGLSLTGLDRIEVLKGPQSAVFGRTTFAGAINYVTRQPSNTLEGAASIDYASFGELRADAFVSGPLIEDKLYAYMSFSSYDFNAPDAWVDISDGSRHGSQSSRGAMGKLTFTPTETLTLRAFASYNKNNDGPASALFIKPSSRNGVIQKVNPVTGLPVAGAVANYPVGHAPTYKPKKGDYNYFQDYLTDPGDRLTQGRFYLQGEWEFAGGHMMTVTGAANRQKAHAEGNGFLGPRSTIASSFISNSISNSQVKDDSVELRVQSPQDQPFRYAGGLYYINIRNIGTPGESWTVAPTAAADSYSAGATSFTKTRDKSAFGAVYFDPIERVTISGELRYQEEYVLRQSTPYTSVNYAAFVAGTARPVINTAGIVNASGTFKAWLPRVNVQYKFNPNANIYATFSRGNNPGGFNTAAQRIIPDQDIIKEEKLDNYEVGFKARLFNQLTINAAAYYMDWKNQQTTGTFYAFCTASGTFCGPTSGGGSSTSTTPFIYSITENRGRTHVKGAEIDVIWNTPIPGLTIRDGLSYNDSKYKTFCSANKAALTQTSTLPPYNCVAVDGNSLESIAKWQNSMNVEYETALTSEWDFFTRADWQYQSKYYDSELNLATTSPFSIFNARIGVKNDTWTFEIYGKNLSDSSAPTRLTRASDPAAGSTNQINQSIAFTPRTPRQFGARAAVKF